MLIQCSTLTTLRFGYGFRLPKAKFESIIRHLGPQLIELYCDKDSSLDFSHEFVMKFLNPIKAKKLVVDYGNTDEKFQQFLEKFPYLNIFRDILEPHFLIRFVNLTELSGVKSAELYLEIA